MANERVSDFRKQVLWQKAQQLAVEIVQVVRTMPRDAASASISNQILRSGASIAANIAEGYGRFSQSSYRHYLSIARGSAAETLSWLDLMARLDYVSFEKSHDLQERAIELQKLLAYRMKTLGDGKTYAVREDGPVYAFD
ncbi:MAG TPA: four helix bundle protein [Dehalococcoidia bacterium]|jgi:four helix bundle protein|nr:four helix bundle protein [Dehalococcoidia bacterium]